MPGVLPNLAQAGSFDARAAEAQAEVQRLLEQARAGAGGMAPPSAAAPPMPPRMPAEAFPAPVEPPITLQEMQQLEALGVPQEDWEIALRILRSGREPYVPPPQGAMPPDSRGTNPAPFGAPLPTMQRPGPSFAGPMMPTSAQYRQLPQPMMGRTIR